MMDYRDSFNLTFIHIVGQGTGEVPEVVDRASDHRSSGQEPTEDDNGRGIQQPPVRGHHSIREIV